MKRQWAVSVALAAGLGLVGLARTEPAEDRATNKPDRTIVEAKAQSVKNLRLLAVVVQNYTRGHGDVTPPAAIFDRDGKALLSWRVLLLPSLGEKTLYEKFNLFEPWDSKDNKKLLRQMPRVFAPPAGKAKAGETFYQAFVGPGAGFEGKAGLRFPASFPDGTANTIMLAEAATAAPWTRPVDLAYDPKKPLPKLGGHFPGGFHVVMWDASVHFLRQDFDPKQMRLAITRDDAQPIDFDKLKR
jgi:hypothetical protein